MIGLTALLGLWFAAPQTTAPQPVVIRTESRLVLVDAVVTDRSGNHVLDLTAKDFQVWEDNREQPVRAATLAAGGSAQDQRSYLVLFFDDTALDQPAQRRARDAAAAFIDAYAAPGRLIAIANYGGSLQITQNFTADAGRLKALALDMRVAGAVVKPQQTRTLTNQRGSMNVNTSDDANALSDYGANSMLQAVRRLAANLSEVPGRKSIVLFTAGSPLTTRVKSALSGAVNMCNRSNIAIYPMDVGGLSLNGAAGSERAAARGDYAGVMSEKLKQLGAGGPESAVADRGLLESLADSTGGTLFADNNDFRHALEQVGNEQSRYYLLTYVPAESPEGSCHALRVRTVRTGTTVRARAGYCNVKPVDLLAGKPVERDLENRASGDQAGNIAAALQAPYFYTEPDTARLHIVMEIPSGPIQVEKVKGKSHAEVNVLGIAYLSDGSVGARFSDTVKLDFATQKELDVFRKQPLHYEKQFHIASGQYQLKVVFSSGASGFGKLEMPLVVDPYDGKRLAISGIALSKEVVSAADLGTAQDAELSEGRTPLVFKDLRVVPAGTNRFRKTDPVALYVEAYRPAVAADATSVEIRLRVLDRKTGDVQYTGVARPAGDAAGSATIPFGLKLKMDALSAGQYRAELEAVDSSGQSAKRTVDFDIVN